MKALNDVIDHDDSFSFLAWTGEPLSEGSILGTNELNEHLVLSSHPSPTLGRLTWVSIPEVELDHSVHRRTLVFLKAIELFEEAELYAHIHLWA